MCSTEEINSHGFRTTLRVNDRILIFKWLLSENLMEKNTRLSLKMTLLLLPELLEENSPCTNAQLDIKIFFFFFFFCPKQSIYINWHADQQVELQN